MSDDRMKRAFKDLKGVWPDNDKLQNLHVNINHDNHYYAMKGVFIGYIGTREEFEACRSAR
jgi:hypothetical protein